MCSRQAIINYISMRLVKGTSLDQGIISYNDFPKEFVDRLSDKNYVVSDSVIDYFIFKDKICHECNKKIPRGFYNGNSSKIHKIGWYVEKHCLTYGINIYGDVILENKCPEHIKKINEIKLYSDGKDIDLITRMERMQILEKRRTAICNEIENEVRSEFGFSKIGESWVTETTLYYEIKEAFPDTKVVQHGRPEWLGLQHLDIWLPEMKIAIEYQGEQHNKPIEVFGGENGYKKIVELDKRKNDLCKDNGISLIYVGGKYNINDVINTIRDIISTNKEE